VHARLVKASSHKKLEPLITPPTPIHFSKYYSTIGNQNISKFINFLIGNNSASYFVKELISAKLELSQQENFNLSTLFRDYKEAQSI